MPVETASRDPAITDRRRSLELAALRCRFTRIADSPVPPWKSSELERAASIPADRFAVDAFRAAAIAIDAGLGLSAEIDSQLRAPVEETVRYREVEQALGTVDVTYRVAFNVHARVPLVSDLDCKPFGGATSVELIVGENRIDQDAHSLELLEIAISVPYEIASITDLNGPSEFVMESRGGLHLAFPAFNHARRLLDHVLTVLHLKGVTTHYLDFEAGRGAPFRCSIVRTFRDGTRYETSGGPAIGNLVPESMFQRNPARICRPLLLAPDALKIAFERAGNELALVANSRVLAEIDHFRRLALLIESSFSGDPWYERLRDDPTFQGIIAAVVARDPTLGAGIKDITSELVELRNRVSHLQVRDDARTLPARFGIQLFTVAEVERLRRFVPLAEQIAEAIVRRLVAGDLLESCTAREPPFHEIARLWEARERYCTTVAGTVALARYVKARLSDGQDHPRIASITQSADEVIATLDAAK